MQTLCIRGTQSVDLSFSDPFPTAVQDASDDDTHAHGHKTSTAGNRNPGSSKEKATSAPGPARADLQSPHEKRAAEMEDSAILRALWRYTMPEDKPEFKWRVAASMGLLIGSKALNIVVRRAH